jgi:hypothetical protein
VIVEYEFTLKFKCATDSAEGDELVERLGEGGCDDAVIGIGQPGRIALNFTREATSAYKAIISALADVKRAIPQSELIEVTPDLAGLTDIADLVGVTRQNMRKLALKYSSSFPAAVHEGSAAVWHLLPVLQWLTDHGDYPIAPELMDVAHVAMQVNLAKQARQLEEPVAREVRELVA